MKTFIVDKSIYTKNNKYGCIININHPLIHKFYEAYLKKLDIPKHIGLTDQQRFEFEGKIGEMIRRRIIVLREVSQ